VPGESKKEIGVEGVECHSQNVQTNWRTIFEQLMCQMKKSVSQWSIRMRQQEGTRHVQNEPSVVIPDITDSQSGPPDKKTSKCEYDQNESLSKMLSCAKNTPIRQRCLLHVKRFS
jgi:hypothetical protein